MKKRLFTLVAVAGLVCLAVVGCSNPNIDTAKVRAALQSIDAGQKAQLEQALTAIDAGKYNDALQPLRKIAFSAKLDKNQGKIIEDTIARVRAKIAKGQ
jgi:predicted negative regulator of RcsB-dependent stress response